MNSIFWVLVIFPVFFMKYKYETPCINGQDLLCFLGSVCLFLEDHMQKWVLKKQKIEKAVTSLEVGNSENSSHLVGAGNVETLHPTHTAEEVPDKIFTV